MHQKAMPLLIINHLQMKLWEESYNAKKSFKSNNPVMQFISPETVEKIEESTETTSNKDVQQITAEFEAKAPAGYKVNPMYIETKSKRVQSLVQPSVYEKIKSIAINKGISVNEAINEALRKYIEESK